MAQVWKVIGGEEHGGLIVREGQDLSSEKVDSRLGTWATVEQVELVGERLNHKLLTGEGPETGWVSIQVKGKDLLVKSQGEEVEELPARKPGCEALMNLVTVVDGKKHGCWQLKVPADCMTVGDWKGGVRSKKLLDDDTVAKFADKLSLKRLYDDSNMGPKLSDDAPLPVDPARVFVTGPGAVQTALANGLRDDFGSPVVPPSRRLCVKSSLPAVHGGYEETFGGSLIFQKRGSVEQAPMTLFRDHDRSSSDGSYKWFFGESTSSFTSFVLKSEGDAPCPEKARWPHELDLIVAFDEAAGQADEELFKDAEFPHTADSIGRDLVNQLTCRPEWLPARRLRIGQAPVQLFDGIQPTDLLQGQIGDCWLIAAMAALAEFPKEVEALFVDEGMKVPGRFAVRLFNHRQGDWSEVVVDEFVPCLPKEWWELDGTPLFARPNGNELWCILLEKAMAKAFGSYADLIANNSGVAFRAFTGVLDNLMWMKPQAAGGDWVKYKLMQKGFDYDPCMQDQDYRSKPEAFFKTLQGYDDASYLMSASIQPSHGPEYRRTDGLVEGHAYSLIKVAEVDEQKLLLLRNPWGNDCEWNGKWSDKSDVWDSHPAVKDALRPSFQDDGLFWMDFEDFCQTWDMVNVCLKSMRTGEDLTVHLQPAVYVAKLAQQKRKVKVSREVKPTVMLKVSRTGTDETEATQLPKVEVSADKLLEALLQRIFQTLDTDGSGKLTFKEATAGLEKVFGVDRSQVRRGQAVFQALDSLDDKDSGVLTEEEFVNAGLSYRLNKQDSAVASAMKAFNASHSFWAAIRAMKIASDKGTIGRDAVAELLQAAAAHKGSGQSDEVWQQAAEQLIEDHDQDGDGELNLQEWMAMMGNLTSLCDAADGGARHHNAALLKDVSHAIANLNQRKSFRKSFQAAAADELPPAAAARAAVAASPAVEDSPAAAASPADVAREYLSWGLAQLSSFCRRLCAS